MASEGFSSSDWLLERKRRRLSCDNSSLFAMLMGCCLSLSPLAHALLTTDDLDGIVSVRPSKYNSRRFPFIGLFIETITNSTFRTLVHYDRSHGQESTAEQSDHNPDAIRVSVGLEHIVSSDSLTVTS